MDDPRLGPINRQSWGCLTPGFLEPACVYGGLRMYLFLLCGLSSFFLLSSSFLLSSCPLLSFSSHLPSALSLSSSWIQFRFRKAEYTSSWYGSSHRLYSRSHSCFLLEHLQPWRSRSASSWVEVMDLFPERVKNLPQKHWTREVDAGNDENRRCHPGKAYQEECSVRP
jgi:hypothetical protein